MEKFDTEPRQKLASPISGLTDKNLVTPTIPDVSLICQNNPTPGKFRPENSSNNYQKQSEALSTKNHNRTLGSRPVDDGSKKLKPITEELSNGTDMRFKFYQRLRENKKIIPAYSSKVTSTVEPIYKHISGHLQQSKPGYSKAPNSPQKSGDCNSLDKNYHQDYYNNLKLLVSLIQSQCQQIKSLKIQIDALISLHQREKSKFAVEKNNVADGKISIGVMTSFEFMLKKKSPEPSAQNNYSSEPIPFRVFAKKTDANSNNKNIEDYDHETDDCLVIDNNVRQTGKVSSKVGWTFYNNMMCQVNELLDTQNDNIQCQKKHYQTQSFVNDGQQRSMMQQWKIFKATMTTGLTDDKIISTDERMNYDSSYYPKVNYQANIVQTTNSIVDDNTSIHMRALALKYLGHNGESTNLQALTKLMSVISTPVNNGNNDADKFGNFINEERYHQLTLENNDNSVFNYKGRRQSRQNVLDISVLKHQPKFL